MDATDNQDAHVFEGAEKKIEIDFVVKGKALTALPVKGAKSSATTRTTTTTRTTITTTTGLRSLQPSYWDDVCALLQGSVLARKELESFDALLITESSIFVYANKLIMLTCGTTRLLDTLEKILKTTEELGLDICWFQYSHKNFIKPQEQCYPYRNFHDEMSYLGRIFERGAAHVLGPVSGDHFYLWMSDYIKRDPNDDEPADVDQMLNIYMYDIDHEVSSLFYKTNQIPSPSGGANGHVSTSRTAEETRRMSGIHAVMSMVGGRVIHDYLFDPCGYSINGVCGEGESCYWTIHVTPESSCSYASFETNLNLPSYEPVVRGIIAVFNPKRFQTVEHVDQDSPLGLTGRVSAMSTPTVIGDTEYVLHNRNVNEFQPGYIVQMTNYHTLCATSERSTVQWVVTKEESV